MPRQQFPTARTEGTLRTPAESALPKKLPTTCQNRVCSLRLQAKQKGQKGRGQKSGLCIGAGQKSGLCIGFGRKPGPFPAPCEGSSRSGPQKPSSRDPACSGASAGSFSDLYTIPIFVHGLCTIPISVHALLVGLSRGRGATLASPCAPAQLVEKRRKSRKAKAGKYAERD